MGSCGCAFAPVDLSNLRERMRSAINALLDYADHDSNCEACSTLRGADCDCGWNEECAVAEAILAEDDAAFASIGHTHD